MMELSKASFVGPEPDDFQTLAKLPGDLRDLLLLANGFILFGGGLHVRGACETPDWHSLRQVWTGDDALLQMFPAVRPNDVPFAQDFLGDQFLLRDGLVIRLLGETGEVEEMGIRLNGFLDSAKEDPDKFLSLEVLRKFQSEGAALEPGELLSVYPPLCTKEASAGISVRAIPAMDRIRFLADFARQIATASDGARVRVIVT
jgi:hypothetical protein